MKRGLVQVADNLEQSGYYLIKPLAVSVVVTILTIPLAAQTVPAGGSNDAWSPAKSIGMFAYPTKNQNADQQLKDESQCYGSAKQNTGVDPQAPAPAATSAESQQAAQQQAAQQTAQAEQQAQNQATAQQQQKLDTFKRPFSACMDARGYSVK